MRLSHKPYYPNAIDIFDVFFKDVWGTNTPRFSSREKCSINSDDRETVISLEIPGVPKNNVGVELEGDNLVISVKQNDDVRTWSAQLDVNEHDVALTTAKLDLGVLTVKVPKTQRKQKTKNVIEVT